MTGGAYLKEIDCDVCAPLLTVTEADAPEHVRS